MFRVLKYICSLDAFFASRINIHNPGCKKRVQATLIIILFIFNPLTTHALPTDSKQKVFIVSDSTIYNFKTGQNIFIGNVKMDQGTTHITADRVTTKNNSQHKIQEAIAYGLQIPAHYWTLSKIGDPEMHAHANIIKYYPIESNVTLHQNVLVTQGENNFKGQVVFYNMHDQNIIVPKSQDGKAILVYNPEAK